MRRFLVLLIALTACGDDAKNGQLPDAPPTVDDAPPDMAGQPPPSVTLTITNLGDPAIGVTVYFVNADDTLVKSITTDANGVASAVMAAGGSVTAIDPFTTVPPPALGSGKAGKLGELLTNQLRTFVGVKPGDHLLLTRTPLDSASFQLDATAVDGANHYDVFTTCGGGTISPGGGAGGSGSPDPGGTVDLNNCHGAADIAIVATNANGETPTTSIAGLYHANATLPNDGDTLDLTGDAFSDLTNVMFTYMNVPDATLTVQHAPLLLHGALGPFPVDVGGGTGTLPEPTTGATKALTETSLTMLSLHDIVDWGAFTTDYMLDLNNLLLPEITNGPSFDTATSELQWSEADTGATPDLTFAAIHVNRPATDVPGGDWRWEFAAPHPAAGELKLPKLPTDVFDWTPMDGDHIDKDPVMNAKVPGGYDAIRAQIFNIRDQAGVPGFVVGASGRVVTVTSVVQVLRRPAAR